MAVVTDQYRPNVLYFNSKEPNCGVHQFGLAIGRVLARSSRYNFLHRLVESKAEVASLVEEHRPAACLYNYHPTTMHWLDADLTKRLEQPQVGTIHEITQDAADRSNTLLFDFHIAPDPTLLLRNPIVFKTGRLLHEFAGPCDSPAELVIGSWGFGYAGKGFERVAMCVQSEFDVATIRYRIPISPYMDSQGNWANAIAQRCRDLITKPGITVEVSHDFLSPAEILKFLASNSINVFCYAQNSGRGISSVLDFALAAGRPIALTRSSMFRHMFQVQPSIFLEHRSLRQILEAGTAPIEKCRKEWSPENLVWQYERIIDKVTESKPKREPATNLTTHANAFVRKCKRKALKLVTKALRDDHGSPSNTPLQQQFGPWWKDGSDATYEYSAARLHGVHVPAPRGAFKYNRILDNEARQFFAPTIALLFALEPAVMERKIPEANVQQAFVFDTVRTLAATGAKILSVGSYEDTAYLALQALGFDVEGIDPLLNYSLDEYIKRPSTMMGSFDVVFATSVIEHVERDAEFVSNMAELLRPNGILVLTCDYHDQYHADMPIPPVCYRMYTQTDFRDRLIRSAAGCSLIDLPEWDCADPDFILAGTYRYTFATLTLIKSKTSVEQPIEATASQHVWLPADPPNPTDL